MTSFDRLSLAFWLLVLLALAAFALPWVVTPGVSLSLNAYDLAEWLSLHPAVRGGSPPLLASGLLRGTLLCLALAVALSTVPARRWLHLLFVVLAAAALMPPLEFFTQAPDDSNYRQQFILAALTLFGGAVAVSGLLERWRYELLLVSILAGLLTTILGLVQSQTLMTAFRLPWSFGVGALGWLLCWLGMILVTTQRNRAAPRWRTAPSP